MAKYSGGGGSLKLEEESILKTASVERLSRVSSSSSFFLLDSCSGIANLFLIYYYLWHPRWSWKKLKEKENLYRFYICTYIPTILTILFLSRDPCKKCKMGRIGRCKMGQLIRPQLPTKLINLRESKKLEQRRTEGTNACSGHHVTRTKVSSNSNVSCDYGRFSCLNWNMNYVSFESYASLVGDNVNIASILMSCILEGFPTVRK